MPGPWSSPFHRKRSAPVPPTVLVVDDDVVDKKVLKRAFAKSGLENPLVFEEDGIEALARLRGDAGKDLLLPPYIILLDINMPRMNGHEFLIELRSDPSPHVRRSVVFVLTTSRADSDINGAYDHNVAGYIVKSKVGKKCSRLIELIASYSRLIELP